MARIIYKKGLDGQNRLESIEGIEIELLNGQKVLIYPKYAELPLLTEKNIKSWNAKEISEIDALKKESNHLATKELLKCGSPAAEYVSNFHSDKHSIFALPTLLAAMEIQYQRNDIDILAETIDGADLLRDFINCIWSCSRCSESDGWFVNGDCGFAYNNGLCESYMVVPTILYKKQRLRKVSSWMIDVSVPAIVHKKPMTGEYLLGKGFTKQFDETTALTCFYSPNKKISVWLQTPKSSSSYCYVYVVDSNNSFRGSLEFTYVNEFEEFLKLCGVAYGEK